MQADADRLPVLHHSVPDRIVDARTGGAHGAMRALSRHMVRFGRRAVVRFVPQTASLFSAVGLPVNLRGLSLDDIKTSIEAHEGVTVLMVEGTIANVTRQPLEVPRLRFAVRNAAGYEVYAWTALPAEPVLAPGDRVSFRSRLASPPADAQDI